MKFKEMKRFLSFVQKEFYHILRDWRTMLILIGMPVIQILLFGFAISNEVQEVPIAVYDPVNSEHTRNIIGKLEASANFEIYSVEVDYSRVDHLFKQGTVRQVIIFDPDFDQKLEIGNKAVVQVIADASDPNTATLVYNFTRATVGSYLSELNQQMRMPMQVNVETRLMYNPGLNGTYLFVPGTISVILMLITAMMTSISITREKELGTMEILLATPMAPQQIIIAKVVPYILLAYLDAMIILVMGYYVFDVPIAGSLAFLLLETALFVITALSLGIFISSRTSSQQVALMASLMGLMLPTILLSGFIFPIENMPLVLRVISNIVPARWFLIIIKGIMLKGLGIEDLWRETLILVGFSLFFVTISIRSFKLRLA